MSEELSDIAPTRAVYNTNWFTNNKDGKEYIATTYKIGGFMKTENILPLVLHLLLMNGVSEYHSKHTKSICFRLIANKIKNDPSFEKDDPNEVLNNCIKDIFKFKKLIESTLPDIRLKTLCTLFAPGNSATCSAAQLLALQVAPDQDFSTLNSQLL